MGCRFQISLWRELFSSTTPTIFKESSRQLFLFPIICLDVKFGTFEKWFETAASPELICHRNESLREGRGGEEAS